MAMKVLFVSSEVFPLIKTGGLADVSGSLPSALQGLGVDIRILIPGYPAVLESLNSLKTLARIDNLPHIGHAELQFGTIEDTQVKVLVIKAPDIYERDGGPIQTNLDWNGKTIQSALVCYQKSRQYWQATTLLLMTGIQTLYIAMIGKLG
jgi:starch synthase